MVPRESPPCIVMVSIAHFTICNALPWSLCLAICGPSQGIGLINSRQSVLTLSSRSHAPCLTSLVFLLRKSFFISPSSFWTSSSIKALFFLNHALSSSSWSLRFPWWISSSSHAFCFLQLCDPPFSGFANHRIYGCYCVRSRLCMLYRDYSLCFILQCRKCPRGRGFAHGPVSP